VEGRTVRLRALLDQDSAFTFIIESLAQILCTQRQRVNIHITDFGAQYSGQVKSCNLQSNRLIVRILFHNSFFKEFSLLMQFLKCI